MAHTLFDILNNQVCVFIVLLKPDSLAPQGSHIA
jgi:hypothetical protein